MEDRHTGDSIDQVRVVGEGHGQILPQPVGERIQQFLPPRLSSGTHHPMIDDEGNPVLGREIDAQARPIGNGNHPDPELRRRPARLEDLVSRTVSVTSAWRGATPMGRALEEIIKRSLRQFGSKIWLVARE